MKFNTTEYETFSRIDDATFPAVLIEGDSKLEHVCGLVKNKNNCIQAGCNFGIFAHYLSCVFNHVYTCEPSTTIYNHAEKNIGSISNISLYNCGLSDSPGKAIDLFDNENCGATKVVENREGNIVLKTIDEIMCDATTCDLIYLDIEGMEYKALEGAVDTINKHRPVVVLENKGLIPGFGGDIHSGSNKIRDYLTSKFNYKYHERLMRDDIFLPL